MRFALLLLLCTSLVAQSQPPARTELQKAVEQFRLRTRELGLRADSPPRNGSNRATVTQWHGRVYENFRNDFLDAVPHQITQNGGTKSLLRRNQFGFNVFGPVVIPKIYHGGNRTFLSVSYEGVRDKTSRSFLDTIATAPERDGDFSTTVDQSGLFLPIYDPRSTRLNPGHDPSQPVTTQNLQYFRDPFPGNRIPADRLNPVARGLASYYPTPNTAIGPFFRNNYFLVTPETNDANGAIIKLDHNLEERHRISSEINISNGLEQPALRLASAANPGPPRREFQARSGSIEYVFTQSAGTVHSFSFEADRELSVNGEQGNPDYAGKVGLRGSGDLAFPAISFDPYIQMGRMSPRTRGARAGFTWRYGFSTRLDKHTLRVNVRHSRRRINTFASRYPAGHFRFAEGVTSLPGIVNTGHSFASFLLGMPESADKTVVVSPSYFRRRFLSAEVRDRWDVASGLSLTIGASIDYASPRYEKYNRQSNIDLAAINPANGRPGALVVAGRNGQGRAFQPQFVKLAPNAGLTWNPLGDSKTVLRASFSRDYEVGFIPFSQWGTQAFNASSSYVSENSQLVPALWLSDGLPPLGHALPDFRPEAANDTTADLIDSSQRQPVYNSARLTLERQLPASFILTVGAGYMGGRNLLVNNNAAKPNAIPLEALQFRDRLNDEDFRSSLRPYPQYKGFDVGMVYPSGRMFREEAFVNVEKRATAGLSLNLRFEASRQWDDYSGWYPRQDYYNSRNEWGLSAMNRPKLLNLGYIYELPFGPGKPLLAYSDWRRYLAQGWAVSGSTTFTGGEPILLEPQFNNTGEVVPGLRVNVVPGVNPHVSDPGPELWFNPAAFDQPDDFTVGDGPRTHPSLRNPSMLNNDISLTKRFSLAGSSAVEFSAVALNFLNHGNWNDPDAVIGPSSAPNANAGKVIGSRGGRVMQLGLRISF